MTEKNSKIMSFRVIRHVEVKKKEIRRHSFWGVCWEDHLENIFLVKFEKIYNLPGKCVDSLQNVARLTVDPVGWWELPRMAPLASDLLQFPPHFLFLV